MSGDSVYDSVGADLLRIVVFDDQAGLDSRSDDDGSRIEVLLREMLKCVENRRYNCCDDDIFDLSKIKIFILEELIDDHTVFISALPVICFESPVGDHLTIPEYSQNDVCVSYIKGK